MEDSEMRALLKDEYLHLQKVIEEFDGRAITIKAWSVTFSLVVLVGAFASHVAAAVLIGSFSAALFWTIEGYWKTFQYAYYDRSGKIERFFAGEINQLVPLQIGSSWFKRWKTGGNRRLLRIMFWPHVALPHVLIFFVGLLLFALGKLGIVRF
jgi:hypothetical protein